MSAALPRQYSVGSGSEASGSSAPIVQTNYDIKASFEELFGVLNQPANDRGKRWSDRNLPESFYTQPSDSRHGTKSPCGGGVRHQSPKRTATGLQIVHGRSVSSPANLVQSLAVKTTPQHSRQNSFDGLLDAAQSPPDAAACNQQQQQSAWPADSAGKYPRYSADGALSAVNPSSLGVPQSVMQQNQQNVNVVGRPNNVLPPNPYQQQEFSSPDLLPLPPGWERGMSQDGEVYYIDHNSKTTSWTHPAMVQHRNSSMQPFPTGVQQPLGVQQSVQSPGTNVTGSVDSRRQLTHAQVIQMQLHQLHQEKLRIRRDQEALIFKERQLAEMMRRSAVISSPTPVSVDAGGILAGGSMPTGACLSLNRPTCSNNSAAGLDMYQMQTIQNPLATHAVHVRQSSGDSGLGMGTTYSLSRTSDDFLCNVDEGMDFQEGRPVGKNVPLNTGDANVFGAQMDFVSLLDSPLDSDQLASTFNDISGDLICGTDMDVQTGGQTWL